MKMRGFKARGLRAGPFLVILGLLAPSLTTATAGAEPRSSVAATATNVKTVPLTSDLTPEWWQKLKTAPPDQWIEQYCSAKSFGATKLCLVAGAAGILPHTGASRDDRMKWVDSRIAALQTSLDQAGLGAKVPVDGSPLEDRIPGPGVVTPNVQPNPGSGAASGTHVVEYPVPTAQSFPIDIKLGPDGALWYSMITNNGTPGIGRVDPNTKEIAMFNLPQETGITYAVNGGPGPYMWWTTIPFEGFGNKVGRINIITHEVENWEIPTPYSYPADLKVGPDGAIWFTETRGNKIGRFDPDSHKFDEWDVGTPLSLPQDLAVIYDRGGVADTACNGPAPAWEDSPSRWKDMFDGGACNATGIWWSNQSPGANSLQRIDPVTHEITTYPYPTPAGFVLDISPGKDGKTVWYWYMGAKYAGFYDPATKQFTQIPTPTPPFLCCGGAGADNAMYWGEGHANTVGRYDLVTKQVSEVTVPSPRAVLIDWQLADGSVWFAEWRANRIGEVVPDQRQELTTWPCGCAAPAGHPFNPKPIGSLLESSRPGGIARPSSW